MPRRPQLLQQQLSVCCCTPILSTVLPPVPPSITHTRAWPAGAAPFKSAPPGCTATPIYAAHPELCRPQLIQPPKMPQTATININSTVAAHAHAPKQRRRRRRHARTLNGLLGGLEAQSNVLVPPQATLANNLLVTLGLVVAAQGGRNERTQRATRSSRRQRRRGRSQASSSAFLHGCRGSTTDRIWHAPRPGCPQATGAGPGMRGRAPRRPQRLPGLHWLHMLPRWPASCTLRAAPAWWCWHHPHPRCTSSCFW